MISFPTLILDNFLDNPDSLKKWALSLNYQHPQDNMYPGSRTKELSYINPYFTNFLHKKILSLYFDSIPSDIVGYSYFQIMDNFKGSGWIHQDPGFFTSIIYLSNSNSNTNEGTSLFKFKKDKFMLINNPQEEKLWGILRNKHYETNSLSIKEFQQKQSYENKLFNKILDIPSKFNRLICFEGTQLHASNGSLDEILKNRLTLITFFGPLEMSNQPPMSRSKKILLL
jgi:hypothetical protein